MAGVPRYEKLRQLLKDKITESRMQVGDRFHSQNELMRTYGLSFSTVTRAMNDLVREGILRREQGRGTFVAALPAARDPLQSGVRRVAVFIPWDVRSPVHVSFRRIHATIEESLPPGCALRLIPYSDELTRMERFLLSRDETDGVLFVYPHAEHLGFVQRVARTQPVVVIGAQPQGDETGCAFTDNRAGAENAVDHLVAAGHRTIGLISGAPGMTDTAERLEGYRAALRRHGLIHRESLVVYTHPLELNGYGALTELFDRNTDLHITAVFAAGDLLAIGAMAAARAMGLRVPGDLSIIGFDDIEEARGLEPPLTTVHVPIVELARRATAMLVAHADRRERPRVIELPSHIVERGTVGPPLPPRDK